MRPAGDRSPEGCTIAAGGDAGRPSGGEGARNDEGVTMTLGHRFMHGSNRTTAAIAVAAATIAAGCGSSASATLSKPQVIAQGARICKAAEHKVSSLPHLPTQHPFGPGSSQAEHRLARSFLSGYADLLEGSVHGLSSLNAPAQDRELLDGYIRETRRAAAKLRAASRAPDPKVEAEAAEAFALFEKASRKTAAYGFPKGVCGSGSSS
jgi:hypothetical protein